MPYFFHLLWFSFHFRFLIAFVVVTCGSHSFGFRFLVHFFACCCWCCKMFGFRGFMSLTFNAKYLLLIIFPTHLAATHNDYCASARHIPSRRLLTLFKVFQGCCSTVGSKCYFFSSQIFCYIVFGK